MDENVKIRSKSNFAQMKNCGPKGAKSSINVFNEVRLLHFGTQLFLVESIQL